MTKQGRASRDVSESHAVTRPKVNAINPGGTNMLGNMQGSHVTSHDDTSYRGEKLHAGRGFMAPTPKSVKTSNCGSQGRYK
jgi:hypothetical protein